MEFIIPGMSARLVGELNLGCSRFGGALASDLFVDFLYLMSLRSFV